MRRIKPHRNSSQYPHVITRAQDIGLLSLRRGLEEMHSWQGVDLGLEGAEVALDGAEVGLDGAEIGLRRPKRALHNAADLFEVGAGHHDSFPVCACRAAAAESQSSRTGWVS